jgi:hypothetical protein
MQLRDMGGVDLYQHFIPLFYAPAYRVAPELPYNNEYYTYALSIAHPRFYTRKLVGV